MNTDNNKPLAEKLGLKPDMSTHFIHAPGSYFTELGLRGQAHRPDDEGVYQFIHAFFDKKSDLEFATMILTGSLADNGMLWVSWPKKSSGKQSDITEQGLRDVLLPLGLVDIKVCSVDDTWSALKFVWRQN